MTRKAHMLIALAVVVAFAAVAVARAGPPEHRNVNGTIWAANRGTDTIRGFDASSGDVVATVSMASGGVRSSTTATAAERSAACRRNPHGTWSAYRAAEVTNSHRSAAPSS